MTNPPTLNEIFKFEIWPAHGKMTNLQPSMKFLNFRFGLNMERWLTLQASLKFLNFRFCLDPQPSLNIFKLQIWPGHEKMTDPPHSPIILNFRFGLDMVRCPTLQPSMKFLNFRFDLDPQLSLNIFQLKIWPGHEKMTDPPSSPKF